VLIYIVFVYAFVVGILIPYLYPLLSPMQGRGMHNNQRQFGEKKSNNVSF